MDELRITAKELCYTAALLGYARLVGVRHEFPLDETAQARELNEVKRALNKRRLLRENSRGEITIDPALADCAWLCAEPGECEIIDGNTTLYRADGRAMRLTRGEDGYTATFEEAGAWQT